MDQANVLIENSKNEVIGVQKRGYVHKMNLIHRSVHIALINSRGKMLLQQRASSKNCELGKGVPLLQDTLMSANFRYKRQKEN